MRSATVDSAPVIVGVVRITQRHSRRPPPGRRRTERDNDLDSQESDTLVRVDASTNPHFFCLAFILSSRLGKPRDLCRAGPLSHPSRKRRNRCLIALGAPVRVRIVNGHIPAAGSAGASPILLHLHRIRRSYWNTAQFLLRWASYNVSCRIIFNYYAAADYQIVSVSIVL